jgi:hypothetical protein
MTWLRDDPRDDHLGGAPRTPPRWRTLGHRAITAGIVLLILACLAGIIALSGCARSLGAQALAYIEDPAKQAEACAPAEDPADTPADSATSTLDDLRAAVDRTAGLYAQAQAALASREASVRKQEQEKRDKEREQEQAARDKAQRDLLAWAERLGYLAALLGVVALGVTFSPWASWIPGGRVTAGLVIGTGIAVSQLSRVLAAMLALTWLLWVIIAIGATAVAAWIVWVVIRETAAHGDRMEFAVTPEQVADAKKISIADQARAGVRGLIRLARCGRAGRAPRGATA